MMNVVMSVVLMLGLIGVCTRMDVYNWSPEDDITVGLTKQWFK